VDALEEESTRFATGKKEILFGRLQLSLSSSLSTRSTWREYSTRYAGAVPRFGSIRSSSATLARSEAGSVVEHRRVVREEFYMTPRSTTKYDYINHVLAKR
jgi:hypothetical protein